MKLDKKTVTSDFVLSQSSAVLLAGAMSTLFGLQLSFEIPWLGLAFGIIAILGIGIMVHLIQRMENDVTKIKLALIYVNIIGGVLLAVIGLLGNMAQLIL